MALESAVQGKPQRQATTKDVVSLESDCEIIGFGDLLNLQLSEVVVEAVLSPKVLSPLHV